MKTFPRVITTRTLPSGAVETIVKAPGLTIYHLAGPYREGESPLYEFAKTGGPFKPGPEDDICPT